jgi:alpha-galactosidase
VTRIRTNRRQFLQLAAGASVASQALLATPADATGAQPPLKLGDGVLGIEFDAGMRSRLWHGAHAITGWAVSEYPLSGSGLPINEFTLREHATQRIEGPHGAGTRTQLRGTSAALEKRIEIDTYERYPGLAVYRVSYRNLSAQPLTVSGWSNAALQLPGAPGHARAAPPGPQFWSYCGSTHPDRRDWVQPVANGFSQDNFMGMNASDYGGGTPVVDVWRRDFGVAIGHLDPAPQEIYLPVTQRGTGVEVSLSCRGETVLRPGEALSTLETFVAAHSGDYFSALTTYREVMAERGLKSPPTPVSAYEAIWCAWGYERECTVQLIEQTLPKVRELGLRWAVIDDGWQSNVGDWNLHKDKFPRGDADMRQLVHNIRAQQLRPRLWYAPLAVAPGADLLHDHTDMLLLDREGAVQNVSWWNSFYLCPAYAKTVAYSQALVHRFMADWGYEGLKIDGQHLNGVPPCFNPAHHHASPEDSVHGLPDFFAALYQTATQVNPEAVVELCPCGTSYSFFNMRAFNQAPASDPESSWQVRHKGKTLKALMGPSAAFAGDHVELSDGGDDFASTVGVGAVVSTKFTWPRDPKPKDSFLLTPERERLWAKWIALYNERQLPRGIYRGELYDIGFDKPEAHVVESAGRLYYAFYATRFEGPIALRGLGDRRHRVRDYFNDLVLGEVSGSEDRLHVAFEHFLVLEAVPA